MGRNAVGEFEQAVLLAILRLGSSAYGVPIRHDLSVRLGRAVSVGAVYTVLERLEGKGFVSSWTGDATPERGGRAKRFYRTEAPGLRALDTARAATRNLWAGLLGDKTIVRVWAKHEADPERYRGVLEEMRELGPPTIRCVEFRGQLYALEGSHRLAAAWALELCPILDIVEPDFPLSEADSFWEGARVNLPAYAWTTDEEPGPLARPVE
jgi:PadR family transcriptional regulator PadR